MKIKANGISINCEVCGSGKWLTLIHGFGDNLEAWWYQLAAFSRHYRVLTYDVRGHGQTETPDEEYTMETGARDLYELLKALGVAETCVLGYSMGGRLAIELALAHPGVVKALVIANSPVAPVRQTQEELKERMQVQQRWMEAIERYGLESVMDEMTTAMFCPGWPEQNPETFAYYKGLRLKNNPGALVTVMRAGFRGEPSLPKVGALACPTLIIAGEHDNLMGTETARVGQATIPDARLKVMATGHASAIEKPEEFNAAVLEFLSQVTD